MILDSKKQSDSLAKYEFLAIFLGVLSLLFVIAMAVFIFRYFNGKVSEKRDAEIANVSLSTLKQMVGECQNVGKLFSEADLKNLSTKEAWQEIEKCRDIGTAVRKQNEISTLSSSKK